MQTKLLRDPTRFCKLLWSTTIALLEWGVEEWEPPSSTLQVANARAPPKIEGFDRWREQIQPLAGAGKLHQRARPAGAGHINYRIQSQGC